MKHLRQFLFALLLALLCGRTYAQAQLSISAIQFPDTAYTSVAYPISATVINTGTSTYSGQIQMLFQTDTMASQSVAFDTLSTDTSVVSITPGDTAVLTGTAFFFDNSQYRFGGDNIVVVWPVSGTASTLDSITTHVYVIDTLIAGLSEKWMQQERITLFPNPVTDKLNLDFKKLKNEVEQVRVLNILGSELLHYPTPLPAIPEVQTLPQGIYFLQVILKNREVITHRFIKTSQP